MIIQHNFNATYTNNRLGSTTLGAKKSAEKLASGFRINCAGDDAAGLAISEKMRAQVRGLSMGIRNIGDGISLTNTADGYLTEMHSMMHRLRELTVQASNDTYTLEEREHIQKEIDQLVIEIDDLTERAEFNGIKLFRGKMEVDKIHYSEPEFVTIIDKEPVIVVGAPFIGPLQVDGGTNPVVAITPTELLVDGTFSAGASQLFHLQNAPGGPSFPLTGVFVIRAGIPGGMLPDELPAQTRTAVLDFSTKNADGNFNLTDFENFFIDAFSDWINAGELSFSIDHSNGAINIATTGLGGSEAFVRVGATCSQTNQSNSSTINPTSLNSGDVYPAGFTFTSSTVFANSAIIGVTVGNSTGQMMARTSRPLTDDELTALGLSINPTNGTITLDTNTALDSEFLWDLLKGHTSFTYSSWMNSTPWTPHSSGTFRNDTTDPYYNLSGQNTIRQVNNFVTGKTIGNMNSISLSSHTFTVDRDGYVLVGFSGSANTPNTHNSSLSYGTIENPAHHSASSLTSSYEAAVSSDIGQLQVIIRNPAPHPNVTINIDFSNNSVSYTTIGGTIRPPLFFTDEDSMVAQMNVALNDIENHPSPPPRFTNGTYSNPVATVSINSLGRLVITPAERHSTVSIKETQSDTPMFVNSTFPRTGQSFPTSVLVINGTPDGTMSANISIHPGIYSDATDFYDKNHHLFAPNFSLNMTPDGRLSITSTATGAEVSIDSITPIALAQNLGFGAGDVYSPPQTYSRDGEQQWLGKSGFPIPGISWKPYEEQLPLEVIGFDISPQALWIQGRDRNGEDQGLYIKLPYISASRLKFAAYQPPQYEIPEQFRKELQGFTGTPNYKGVDDDNQDVKHELNVLTRENANLAIDTVQSALHIISKERARFGAYTNALEHMRTAVTNTHENITSAKSRIRDTDMATAMVEFTKYNILLQATQAMLAQANQAPQQILQLLR